MEIYRRIGARIRYLRDQRGISQEELAQALKVSANTISRWETATYKISVGDLQKVTDFFKVPLSSVLPAEDEEATTHKALLSATGDLPPEDIAELIAYAEFRRVWRRLEESKHKG